VNGISKFQGIEGLARGKRFGCAEGYERNSDRDFIRFLLISKGSLSELRTQLEIANSIGYLSLTELEEIDEYCKKLGSMITKLIQSRKNRFTNSP